MVMLISTYIVIAKNSLSLSISLGNRLSDAPYVFQSRMLQP